MRLSIATVAPVIAMMAGQASAADITHDGYVAPIPQTVGMARHALIERLNEVRLQGLERRAEDGGTLTVEHRDQLQAKIDSAQRRYATQLRRIYPFGVPARPSD